MYKCEICGKEYETIKERNMCEAQCLQKYQDQIEQERKIKLQKEQQHRYEEVAAAEQHYLDLIQQYQRDYGRYYTNRTFHNNLNDMLRFLF